MRTPKSEQMKLHRRSIRLKEYDYCVGGFVPSARYAAGTKPAARQPGAYFVTIATFQRDGLFGQIANEEMQLNEFGRIAGECWCAIPEHFANVELGTYVIMPNHVHGIIIIHENGLFQPVGAQHAAPLRKPNVKPGSLGAIIRSFKSAVTRNIGQKNIWQRNYYEHMIRNEKEWDKIHRYIESNPINWESDNENPLNL